MSTEQPPREIVVAVEKGSDFFIYFTDSELRRKGRMTAVQKRQRRELEARLGRPDPKAIEKDMRELLQVTLQNAHRATVYSDDHPAYRRSIKGLRTRIRHRVTPGKAHRDRVTLSFLGIDRLLPRPGAIGRNTLVCCSFSCVRVRSVHCGRTMRKRRQWDQRTRTSSIEATRRFPSKTSRATRSRWFSSSLPIAEHHGGT